MPRKVVKYQGYNVRLKAGQSSLSEAQKNAIGVMEQRISERGGRSSKGEGCTVVFFGKKAVQRCTGRKLSAAAKRRWGKQVRSKALCRRNKPGHSKKVKLFSNRCR